MSFMSYSSDIFTLNLKKLLYGINGLIPDLCSVNSLKETLISNVYNIIENVSIFNNNLSSTLISTVNNKTNDTAPSKYDDHCECIRMDE